METWRSILSPPDSGIANMALDEALLARARRTGERVLRVYTWSDPTLSLGRNQTARGVFDGPEPDAHGVAVVRRLTGGRALLHHREITYSVTGPLSPGSALRTRYDEINAVLLWALQSLGAPVTLAPRTTRLPPPGSAPCFELPAPGEIVLNGRKLVGSALVRDGNAFLQHGSILIEDDQPLLDRLSLTPGPTPSPAATLHKALGRIPTPAEVAEALLAALGALRNAEISPLELDPETERDQQAALHRYRDETWTWRK